MPHCRRLLWHLTFSATCFAFDKEGSRIPMSRAMMAITTSSSMIVNARVVCLRVDMTPCFMNRSVASTVHLPAAFK